MVVQLLFFFVFKQKTAYEMRISDWSSDVCSSDLAAKPEHYTQMQLYMRKMGLTVALYVAVCKNTDDLYMEIIYLNPEYADQYLDRGDMLVWRETRSEERR